MTRKKFKDPEVNQGRRLQVDPKGGGTSTQTAHVRFSFEKFRSDCVQICTADEIQQALDRLRTLSGMTWQQVTDASRTGLGHEKIPRSQLTCPCDLSSDVEDVLSFRYSKADRIIGHRDGAILRVLWFSHAHNAYPAD